MTARRRRAASSAALAAVLLALATGCSTGSDTTGAAAVTSSAATSSAATSSAATSGSNATPATSTSSSSTAPTIPDLDPSLPKAISPVALGELTGFRVDRGRMTLLDAGSSGLARYNTSDRCEVPGLPCYDAPTFDKVARIDVGAPPTVPGKDTTFVTGHSNRYQPDDVKRGVFSHLQDVRAGDVLVLTTTKGIFVYLVTTVLSVPFDKLTSTPEVVDVRPDTVVAISCVIGPDRDFYLGNYVVVGSLRGSTPR